MRPARRWFQYSLRAFFVVMTALGIWLGLIVNSARDQREAIDKRSIKLWRESLASEMYFIEREHHGPALAKWNFLAALHPTPLS